MGERLNKEILKADREVKLEVMQTMDERNRMDSSKSAAMKSGIKDVVRCLACIFLFVILNVSSSLAGFLCKLFQSDYLSQAKMVLDDPVEIEKCVEYGLQNSVPIASTLMFLYTGFVAFLRRKKEWRCDLLGLWKKFTWREVAKYVLLGVVINLVVSYGLNFLPDSWVEMHDQSTAYLQSCNPWLLLFTAGILAPICEEYFFRGICVLESNFFVPTAITSSLLFALCHGGLIQMFYAFIFGIWFSWENRKKGSIIPSVIIHIAVNVSTILTTTFF